MINFFDILYSFVRLDFTFFEKSKINSGLRFLIRYIGNIILPIYFDFSQNNKKYSIDPSNKSKDRIIVSLTSFPDRINKVWLVIETMLHQTHKPDKLILWLSIEQFPNQEKDLPKKLLLLKNRGLEIKFKDKDLRSHKKYYYALREFSNDLLITVDDDFFYNSHTIEELYYYHKCFPNSVIARYAYKMTWSKNGELNSYNQWKTEFRQDKPQQDIFFGSGGGTLLPITILPKETLNKNTFMEKCFYADDIWLNTMCHLGNIGIFRPYKKQCSLFPILIKNNYTLNSINLQNNQNDIQLKNVRDYFKTTLKTDPFDYEKIKKYKL